MMCRLFVLTCWLALSACGGGGGTDVIDVPPPITAQPVSQALAAGAGATFSVAATGSSLGYQWQRSVNASLSWADIAGAVSNSYIIAVVDASMNGHQFRVLVRSGSATVTSSAVTLSVMAPVPPAIAQAPQDQALVAGADAVFSVSASGNGLLYQWQSRPNAAATWADVAGASASTLTLSAVALADNGRQLRVRVTNGVGSTTSAAALLSVSPAPAAPAFTTPPSSVSVQAGQPATFTVAVTGSPTPALQWQSSSNAGASFSDIAGATAASYTAAAVAVAASGTQYRVLASNALGTATSVAASLTVTAVPTVVLREVALSVGAAACAVRSNASLACWGDNQTGQVDGAAQFNPNFVSWFFVSPTQVPGVSGIEQVATGPHTCAVRADGTVACWGVNSVGQLGLGASQISTFLSTPPTTVPGLSGVARITVGDGFSCALKTDGTVACWGQNGVGQLGDGSTTSRPSPTAVPGLSGVTAISAGSAHACALRTNGTVMCWGYNADGELGDGSTVNRPSPVAVAALTNVRAIVAGGSNSGHTCALKSDATVACWGSSSLGANGSESALTTPRVVPGLIDAAAVATGDVNSCAIRAAGTVVCWGGNYSGQLGTGTPLVPPFSVSPVAVVGLSNVVAIAAGYGTNCAVKSTGSVYCWGYNGYGQLGDGSFTARSLPQQINGLTMRLR